MAQETLTNTAEREITDTRVIHAPRELIWKVWTEPVHVTQWWGPSGFTNTTHSMDVRVGGEWVHTMHGPDGRDYPSRIRYVELVEPERIVYDHVNPPGHRTTVTFEDLGGTTKMTFRMVFETPEEKRKVVEAFKADVGLQQTLGRMEEYLAKL
jgi:uncharacterized protein YndB with AHSA1/START domain